MRDNDDQSSWDDLHRNDKFSRRKELIENGEIIVGFLIAAWLLYQILIHL